MQSVPLEVVHEAGTRTRIQRPTYQRARKMLLSSPSAIEVTAIWVEGRKGFVLTKRSCRWLALFVGETPQECYQFAERWSKTSRASELTEKGSKYLTMPSTGESWK